MFSIRSNILYIILFNGFLNNSVKLSVILDNDIAISERKIRNIISNLFSTFGIADLSNKPRLKVLSTIHNFFTSITLKDCINLNEIAKLTEVTNIDNNMLHFMKLINEVLDEDENITKEMNDMFVKTYVDIFIGKLRDLNVVLNHTSVNEVDKNRLDVSRNLTKSDINTPGSKVNVSSDLEFWKPNSRRLYRGHRARIKNFPFMASVQFFNRFQCGGSIIKSDLVITSSSCLQLAWNNRFFRENPAFLSVRVGTDYAERGGENVPVLEIYFHPDYNPKTLKHNLAIMRLTKRLHFSKRAAKIKKIDFDRDPGPLSRLTDGITVLGWGARDNRNIVGAVTNRLAYDVLHFYPRRECREVYSKVFVTKRHFCGGFFSKGGGACNRDAGGPGIVGDKLMGVISFGSLYCGAVDSPTVFTKLGHYTDWIEEVMEQDVPYTYKFYQEPPRKNTYVEPISPTSYTFVPLSKTTPTELVDKGVYLRALEKISLFKKFLTKVIYGDKND